MNKKLSRNHLEVLFKIAICKESVKITKIEEDRLAFDLMDAGLIEQDRLKGSINTVPCCYKLNDKGRRYFNDILQYGSEHFNNNSN